MKYKWLIGVFLLLSIHAIAQKHKNALQLMVGNSQHGTGDLSGFVVEISHEHLLTRVLRIQTGISSTIHFGTDGNRVSQGADPSHFFHYTTAGVQLQSQLGIAFFATPIHELKIAAGPMIRFQSSSYPNGYGMTVTPGTQPVYVFSYDSPNSLNLGYTTGILYLINVRKIQIGARIGFQNDTRGDAITNISLLLGRVLN